MRAVWSRLPPQLALKIALKAGEIDPERVHPEDMLPYLSHMTHVDFPMFLRMLRLPEPPTALFTGQNLLTIGACRALRALGLENTVAMVGFDDFPLADMLRPGITVVAQDVMGMGRLAAETLFRRLDGDRSPYRTHVLPTWLITRGSGEIGPTATARG